MLSGSFKESEKVRLELVVWEDPGRQGTLHWKLTPFTYLTPRLLVVLCRTGYEFDFAGRPETSWLWCRKLLSQNKAVEMKPRRIERQLIWNI